MRCVVVSVAACVGIITDEVMTLTHQWANTDIEHSSFGPADGRTSPLFSTSALQTWLHLNSTPSFYILSKFQDKCHGDSSVSPECLCSRL